MKIKVENFIIENNNKVIKGTDTLVFGLSSLNGEYLGIMTFKNNKIPDDKELLNCCKWKAHEEKPWKYEKVIL